MPDFPYVPRSESLPKAFSFAHDPIASLHSFITDYGPTYYLYVGGIIKSLITTEPEIIQHVLQTNHRKYEKSQIQTEVVAKYTGRGLLTNTGESWLRQRRLIQPGFHRKRLASLTEIMQSVIDRTMDKLAIQSGTGQSVDVYEEILQIAFQVVGRAIFSEDINEGELDLLSEQLTKIQEVAIREVRLPFLKWWWMLTGKLRNTLALSQAVLNKQGDFVRRRQASGVVRDDLLQMLLDARYRDTGEPMTHQQLIEETGILFVAGHETSANALTWALYLLAQHPQVQTKIREELDQVAPNRAPTFEELRQLPYLTNVINETMRLYPPAWITDRVALEDDEVNGRSIPKGTIVTIFIHGLHHSPQLWDDPEAFRPERFEQLPPDQHSFAFLPFGGGPRLCIGNNFAMMEMQLVLAAWLRRFRFELDQNWPVEAQALITLRPKRGIRMYLHENE